MIDRTVQRGIRHGKILTTELARAVGVDPAVATAIEFRIAVNDIATMKVYGMSEIEGDGEKLIAALRALFAADAVDEAYDRALDGVAATTRSDLFDPLLTTLKGQTVTVCASPDGFLAWSRERPASARAVALTPEDALREFFRRCAAEDAGR